MCLVSVSEFAERHGFAHARKERFDGIFNRFALDFELFIVRNMQKSAVSAREKVFAFHFSSARRRLVRFNEIGVKYGAFFAFYFNLFSFAGNRAVDD